MPRKPLSRRLNLEALEERTLLSTGLGGNLSRQAQLTAYLAAIRAGSKPAADVGSVSITAQGASAQQGQAGRQSQQQLRQQRSLAQQKQQQLRAQGKILSTQSLDNTTIQVRLKQRLNRPLDNLAMYRIPGLTVAQATPGKGGTSVILKTSPQSKSLYVLTMLAAPTRGRSNRRLARAEGDSGRAPTSGLPTAAQTLGTISFIGTAAPSITPPNSNELPRVVSATSTSNTEVIVQFSEPMSDRALVAQNYEISPENVNSESGRVIVRNARFQEIGTGSGSVINRSTVILTTESQNEMDYQVRSRQPGGPRRQPARPGRPGRRSAHRPDHGPIPGHAPESGGEERATHPDR